MRKVILTLMVALGFVLSASAQNRVITGRITDDKGAPVSGVSVISSDKASIGTTSDASGNYSIEVGPFTKNLIFSSVNFETQRLAVRSGQMNVRLASANTTLDDVVVTGVRNIKKTDYAGSATRLRRQEVENKPVGSFDQLLQGAVPGLLALTSSGQPGTSATIIIRGQGSITGGTNPLYVIDGIPIEQSTFQGLNPNDFATVDILKDASATALYGSRGSAGVIVITTKKGTPGKLKVSYSTQYGIKQKPDFAFTPMTTQQLLASQEAYGKIAGGGIIIPGWYYSKANPRYATLTPAQQAAEAATYDSISRINTNWKDYFFRNGPFSNNEISISGGTGRTRFFSSVALYKEDGITQRTNMKRYSVRNNVDYADDKFSIAFASTVAYTKRNFQQSTVTNNLGNPFLAVNITTPYARVFKADGTYATGTGSTFAGTNQLDLTKYDENYSDQVKTLFNLNSAFKITGNFTLGLTAGVDFRETQASNYGSQLAYSRLTSTTPTGKAGFQTEALSRFVSLDVRPSLNFDKTYGGRHRINAGLYTELIHEYTKNFSGTGFGIDPRIPNTPAAITQGNATNLLFAQVTGGKSENVVSSAFALGSYTFNDKYAFTGSFRRDGSSKLPEKNRFTNFFSAGLIWTLSKEKFLENSKVVSDLRLRGTYGNAGNHNNFPGGDFRYLDQYGTGNYAGLSTIAVANLGNPDLKWETIYQTNIGTDFSLFKNRIYGSVDIYEKITKDLFVSKTLTAPAQALQPIDVNAGRLSNKGIEFDLSFEVIRNKNFVWTLNGKAGYNKNRILDLGGLQAYPFGTGQIAVGTALSSPWEVRWGGVDAATGQPLYYTKDGVLTTTYSAADKVQTYGTSEAPWKGGFSSNMRYKGFEFYTFFTFQQGAVKTDNLEFFTENPVGFLAGGYNQSASLRFWTKPGDLASTPSPLYGTNFSSKLIHDASFLRLKDVTLAYSLPSEMLTKLKFVSRVRFYAQSTNVYMWTKWRGMDPEAGPFNINLSEFPNPRSFTFGLDVTF